MFWIVVSLLIALQTPQDTTAPPGNAGEKQECQISGQVVAHEGGYPLKDAQVILERISSKDAKKQSQRTGPDGKFCFKNIEPGRYSATAGRIGYVRQWYGAEDAWSEPTFLTIETGQKFEPILFRLLRGAVITGRVMNEDSEPLQGVVVQAWFTPEQAEVVYGKYGAKRAGNIPVQQTTTNDLGEYRLAGLPPGKYLVNAFVSDALKGEVGYSIVGMLTVMMSAEEDTTEIYVPTYYPGTTHASEAAPIEVKAGDETTASLQLFHQRTVTVSGVLLNEDGTPSPLAAFEFTAVGSSSLNAFVNLESDGHFTIKHVLPGSYIAKAQAGFSVEQTEKLRQKVEVGQQDVNLRLSLKSGVKLTGTLIVEGGTVKDLSEVQLSFSSMEGDRGSGYVQKDGSLRVPSLMPGTYISYVTGLPDQYYIKRVVYGSHVSSDAEFTVEAGAVPSKLDIAVSPNAATLEVTVQNGKLEPVGGATIIIRPEKRKDEDAHEFLTDQNGKFEMHGLAPGKYVLVARKGSKPASQPPAETSVTLAESEKKTVTIKIE